MKRRILPFIDGEPRIERRGMLMVGVAAVGLAACRADADLGTPGPDADNGGDSSGPDADDASSGSDATDSSSPVDTGPTDTGVVDTAVDVPPMCSPGPRSLGSVTRYASGTWTLLSSPRVIVAHDSGGLYAYSSVCTHSGCIVDPPDSSGQAFCACHGSLFDGNGAVLNGPAFQPLAHYLVTVCMGIAYVDTSMTVAASTRTPV